MYKYYLYCKVGKKEMFYVKKETRIKKNPAFKITL